MCSSVGKGWPQKLTVKKNEHDRATCIHLDLRQERHLANINVVRGGMDKFARPAVDPLYPDTNSCIASLRSNRIKRMNVDKSAVQFSLAKQIL